MSFRDAVGKWFGDSRNVAGNYRKRSGRKKPVQREEKIILRAITRTTTSFEHAARDETSVRLRPAQISPSLGITTPASRANAQTVIQLTAANR
jgi:hypothetical protein